MRLSAPIFRLKGQARRLAREAKIPLHDALDRLARQEGFRSWSHLSASISKDRPAAALLAQLSPGDLVLLGLQLALEAARRGRPGLPQGDPLESSGLGMRSTATSPNWTPDCCATCFGRKSRGC